MVALVVTGLILSSLYRSAVERAFDERLDVYVKGLIAELTFSDSGLLQIARDLPEPRFNFPLSGWYWQIENADPAVPETIVSPSLLDRSLDLPDPSAAALSGPSAFYIRGLDGEGLRVISRRISFSARDAPLVFTVAGNASEIDASARSFNETLVLALSILGVGLISAAALQVRYGLGPVRELRAALARIRSGHEGRISGEFPSEIAPLAREVNALLDANEEVIDRARTQVGNLAHALKTPLSVLSNDADTQETGGERVHEQVAIMRQHVDHYLERARVAARANVIGAATDVEPVISAIVRTLQKIHADRGIDVRVHCARGLRFRGEKQDLEEMVGNLLDNAFKWSQGSIAVHVAPADTLDGSAQISIEIEDNGPGLEAEQCEQALKRGRRLDESKPGSGLGLSIVADIAALYRGTLELGRAALGGLNARLVLPAYERG